VAITANNACRIASQPPRARVMMLPVAAVAAVISNLIVFIASRPLFPKLKQRWVV